MTRIINSLKEMEMGEQYLKEGNKELKINCKVEFIQIYDLTAGMVYSEEINNWDTVVIFNRLIENKNIQTAEELVEYLAFKSDFRIREIYKNEVFNPFFKELEGELKIKSKTGRFTKAQVEKILKHKDTKVIRKNVYTDDYAHDAENNYSKDIEVSRLDMLQEVKEDFHKACEFENGEFTVFTVGYSKSTRIINPNITIC